MYDSQRCCFFNIQVGDIMSGEGKTNEAVVKGAQKCNPLSGKPYVVCFVSRPLEHISFIK